MGGDGGCIATQREFMRGTVGSHHSKGGWAQGQNHGSGTTGGDAETGNFRGLQRAARVRQCALTSEPLRKPVVADELGQLFNKLSMLEALSAKSLPARLAHVTGLRDLVDVRCADAKESADYVHGDGAPFAACPVTGKALDGSEPFVVARTSGWLLSRRAVRELGVSALQADHGPFEEKDLVDACPDEHQVRPLAEALATQKAEAKAKRKAAKRDKKRKGAAASEEAAAPAPAAPRRDGLGVVVGSLPPKAPEPPRKKQSVAMGAAAEVARKAREQTQKDHKTAHLGQMFHDEKDKSVTGAADLFIATAPRRYNLN